MKNGIMTLFISVALLSATCCLWGQTDKPAAGRRGGQPGAARAVAPKPAEPVKQIKSANIEVAVDSSSGVWDAGQVPNIFHKIEWRKNLGEKGLKMPSGDACEIKVHIDGGGEPFSSRSYLDPMRLTWRFWVTVEAIGKAEALKGCDVAQAAKLLAEKLESDIHNAYSLRLKELNEEHKKLQGMTNNSRERLEELLKQGMQWGVFDSNLDSVNKRGAQLESMREDLKVALVGKLARKKALASEIARLTAVVKNKTAADPVTRELEKIIKLQMINLGDLQKMVKGGHASQEELRQTEIKLAESRVRLAERREKVGQKQGNGRLAKLNVELAELGTDIVEIDAQLEGTSKMVEVLANKCARIRISGSSLNIRIAEAEKRLKELTQQFGKLETILDRAGEAQVTLGTPEVTTEPFPGRRRPAKRFRGSRMPGLPSPNIWGP